MEDWNGMSDRDLLRATLEWLGGVEDEGPRGEGWHSERLRGLLNEIELRVNPEKPFRW